MRDRHVIYGEIAMLDINSVVAESSVRSSVVLPMPYLPMISREAPRSSARRSSGVMIAVDIYVAFKCFMVRARNQVRTRRYFSLVLLPYEFVCR